LPKLRTELKLRWARWKFRAKRALVRLLPADLRLIRTGEAFLRGGEREVRLLPILVVPDTVVIDVGAHIGDYTYALCKQLGPLGRVIAFEPQPGLARQLRKAAKRLQLPVTVHQCALSCSEGESELSIPTDDGIVAPGLATLERRMQPVAECYRVPLRRLDDVCREVVGTISFIKIDVEGHELDVLRGSVAILQKHRPNLLIEIEQRHTLRPITETFDFLAAQNYRGEFMNPAGSLIPLSEFRSEAHQDVSTIGTRRYVSNFVFRPM
jgi:FkbM family methyltransferase